MITRKLATLGLGLALALGAAGADAAQPAAQPAAQTPSLAGTDTASPTTAPAKPAATPMTGRTAKVGKPKIGTTRTSRLGAKAGAAKLNSGRSVAVSGARKVSHRRLHQSLATLKRLHRTHVAHVVKKASAKHA